MEENTSLSHRLADQARTRGHNLVANRFEEKVREAERHATVIRQLLLKGETTVTPGASASQANDETRLSARDKP